MTYHEIKITQRFFEPVANKVKTFELRKNDRDYRVGDTVKLLEVLDRAQDIGTNSYILGVIRYVLKAEDASSWGLADDHCIFGLDVTHVSRWPS